MPPRIGARKKLSLKFWLKKLELQDRPLGAHLLHGPLGTLGLLLAAAGEEQEPPNPLLHREGGEGTDGLDGSWHREVRVVGDVNRPHVAQRGRPRGFVTPVEWHLAGAGADPYG